jgi:HEAT repeat protein
MYLEAVFMPNKHIFISYKSQEREYAYSVRDKLQSWGYKTWLDVDNLFPQSFWDDSFFWQREIYTALKNSYALVCIVTLAAIQSRYVTSEWDTAIAEGITVVPLIFEKNTTPRKYTKLIPIRIENLENDINLDELRLFLESLQSKHIDQSDIYNNYLKELFEFASVRLGKLMIKTLSTYGLEGREMGDPISLLVASSSELAQDRNSSLQTDNFDNMFFASQRQLILLGDPGSGKTITLLQKLRDAAIERILDHTAPLPFYANISTWNNKIYDNFIDWLKECCLFLPDNLDIVKSIDAGTSLLLLDGLDELPFRRKRGGSEEQYDQRELFLNSIPRNSHLVITCRKSAYKSIIDKPSKFRTCELVSLTDTQIRAYLRDQTTVLKAFEADAELTTIMRNPMLLSFLAFTFEEMPPQEQKRFNEYKNFPEIRDAIFGNYIKNRLNHEKVNASSYIAYTLDDIIRIFGYLGIVSLIRSQSTSLVENDFTEVFDAGENDDIIEFGILLNIISRNDLSDELKGYYFVHPHIRDYLAYQEAVSILADGSPSEEMRLNAAETLGILSDGRATDVLINTLKDISPLVQQKAVSALSNLLDPRAILPISEYLESTDTFIAPIGISSIFTIDDIYHIEQVEMVIELSNQLNANFPREAFKRNPNSFVDPRPHKPIINITNQYSSKETEQHSKIVSSLLRSSESKKIFLSCLSHPNPLIRSTSAKALGLIGDEGVIPRLLDLVYDRDWKTKVNAVFSIIQLDRSGKYISHFMVLLLIDPLLNRFPDESVRITAAKALGRLGSDIALMPLVGAATDPSKLVRYAVTKALVHLGQLQAYKYVVLWEPFIEKLQDWDATEEELYQQSMIIIEKGYSVVGHLATVIASLNYAPIVRNRASNVLSSLTDPRVTKDLIKLLRYKNLVVKSHALVALSKIKDEQAKNALSAYKKGAFDKPEKSWWQFWRKY